MFPPFPQFTAHHYIQKLIDDLDCGKVKIQQITEVSKERLGSGLMLGCLLAYDKKTNQRIILFALSGISRQLIFADSEKEEIHNKAIDNIKLIIKSDWMPWSNVKDANIYLEFYSVYAKLYKSFLNNKEYLK